MNCVQNSQERIFHSGFVHAAADASSIIDPDINQYKLRITQERRVCGKVTINVRCQRFD